MLGTHDGDWDRYRIVTEVDVHGEPIGDRLEIGEEVSCRSIVGQLELDALEEHRIITANAALDVLFGVDDVAALAGNELRSRGDHSESIGAGKQQDVRHQAFLSTVAVGGVVTSVRMAGWAKRPADHGGGRRRVERVHAGRHRDPYLRGDVEEFVAQPAAF